jgi:hypothetical protein
MTVIQWMSAYRSARVSIYTHTVVHPQSTKEMIEDIGDACLPLSSFDAERRAVHVQQDAEEPRYSLKSGDVSENLHVKVCMQSRSPDLPFPARS